MFNFLREIAILLRPNPTLLVQLPQIVQLAAYTPTDHFEQYIMPYMNLNPAARQRHQVRVISIGFYRMLKSMQTYKVRPK